MRLLVFWVLTSVWIAVSSELRDGPVVSAPIGRLQGWQRTSRSGQLYNAWTKIPFAQPPVGRLRFQPPVPVKKWKGTLNATGNCPLCIQAAGGVEDCLYLNVFRPSVVRAKKLPVLVYIHGGSFQSGNVGPRESADYLMDEDIVLVQISYRLNGFGFMSLGDTVMPGNYGLKDQAMALRWIDENISAFRGDPSSVTVFGGSAGGASAHYLLKSPMTENYVSRAVSHSGTINPVWSLLNTNYVKKTTEELALSVGCLTAPNERMLYCLQNVNATLLSRAITYVSFKAAPTVPFVPVMESKDVRQAFMTEDLSVRYSNKPWITSTANGEYILFLSLASMYPDSFIRNIQMGLRPYLENLIASHQNNSDCHSRAALLKNLYYTPSSSEAVFLRNFSRMHMDDFFVMPIIFNALGHKGPKWLSRMEYRGEFTGWNPSTDKRFLDEVAGHDDEKFYYFNYRSLYPKADPKERPADYQVSRRLIKYLVNFAYYSDPTPAGGSSLQWKQYQKDEYLRITAAGDFIGDHSTFQVMKNAFNLWFYMLGWK